MNFLDQFGDPGLKNADLFGCGLVKRKKAASFRVKDGIVYANRIGCKRLKCKELLRRELPTRKRTEFFIRRGVHVGHLFSGTIVFQQI